MEDNNTYRVPEGFNPHTCMDTIRGLTDAIHHYITEGPGTERIPSRGNQGGLISLIDLLQQHVYELHAYLIEIENSTTLQLPLTDEDFELYRPGRQKIDNDDNGVREEPPLYLVG